MSDKSTRKLAKLEARLQKKFAKALAGDIKAARRVVKIMRRMNKLRGQWPKRAVVIVAGEEE